MSSAFELINKCRVWSCSKCLCCTTPQPSTELVDSRASIVSQIEATVDSIMKKRRLFYILFLIVVQSMLVRWRRETVASGGEQWLQSKTIEHFPDGFWGSALLIDLKVLRLLMNRDNLAEEQENVPKREAFLCLMRSNQTNLHHVHKKMRSGCD